MAPITPYISVLSFLKLMAVTVSMLAVGPMFSFELELTSSELASYQEEAKYLALEELEGLGGSVTYNRSNQQINTFHQIEDPYVFVSLCFLIPPPKDGYVENKKIMLHLLGRLTPQNRYAFFNISTTKHSTNSLGGAYCNGTAWDHDAYREKCTYCTSFLLNDPSMIPKEEPIEEEPIVGPNSDLTPLLWDMDEMYGAVTQLSES